MIYNSTMVSKCKKSISGAAITNGQAHFKTLKISTLHVNTSVVISMETLLEERNNIVGAGKNHFVHGPRRVPLGVRGTVLQKPAIGWWVSTADQSADLSQKSADFCKIAD